MADALAHAAVCYRAGQGPILENNDRGSSRKRVRCLCFSYAGTMAHAVSCVIKTPPPRDQGSLVRVLIAD
jgi:hypothetical protein